MRTVNKKYYKRIGIEDMERAHLDLEARSLSWSHENNTLVVTYKKPKLIVEAERESKRARLAAPDEQSRKLPEEVVGFKPQYVGAMCVCVGGGGVAYVRRYSR